MKPAVQFNPAKNGIELTFPGKPSAEERSLLKQNGYIFHNKNKYWWAVIDENALKAAGQIIGTPIHTTCDASIGLIKRFLSSLGKNVKPNVPASLKRDISKVLNAGNTNLKKELEELLKLTVKMETLANDHGTIKPSLGNKTLLKHLQQISSPIKVDTRNGQFALFGIRSKQKEEADHLLYGIDFSEEEEEGLGGTGLTPYDVITNMILEKVKKGTLSWRKSWSAGSGGSDRLPAMNFVTKKPYKGINALILNFLVDRKHPYWFTFNQIKQLGGKLNEGAKYAPVCYYNRVYKLLESGETISEEEALKLLENQYLVLPFLRYYKAYNAEDITGIDTSFVVPKIKEVEAIKSAEELVENMPKRPPISHGGDDAFYSPGQDRIQMPRMVDFDKEQEYYGTLFHELVHSTGHKSRVGREFKGSFGDKDYAFEELIAELGASFLCGEAGILYYTLDNTAAYIKGWAKTLTNILTKDNKFIFRACAQAQKAADYIQALHIGNKNKRQDRKPVSKGKAKTSKKLVPGIQTELALKGIEEPIIYIPPIGSAVSYPKPTPAFTAMGSLETGFMDEEVFEPIEESNGLPSMANAGNKGPVETFKFIGDFGRFLGPIAKEPDSSVVVAITAEKGTGKSHALFQAMEEIASSGYPILFGSYEEFINSSLFTRKRDKYISQENQQLITAVDQRFLPNTEAFFEEAKKYPVVILDSAQELEGGVDINKLRGNTAGQLYIIIFHATTEGKLKGGSAPQHKADVVIVGEKDNDFKNNYFYYGKDGKNRYQVEQGLKYSPYHQKLIDNESE